MTAHVVFESWDADHPATQSPRVIADIIRRRIGFDGLLMSDDIEMQALSGPVTQRATAALTAGCDVVLHCSGDFAAMTALTDGIGPINDTALARLDRALPPAATSHRNHLPEQLAETLARRDALLALVG